MASRPTLFSIRDKHSLYQKPIFIPSQGLPTTVLDRNGSIGVVTNEYVKRNPVLIGMEEVNSLSVFENEITSFQDLLRFESVLRALILHHFIDVLTPSIVVNNTGGNWYWRQTEQRNQSTLEILGKLGAHDLMLPDEALSLEGDRVTSSTLENSVFNSMTKEEVLKALESNELFKKSLFDKAIELQTPHVHFSSSPHLQDLNSISEHFLESLDATEQEKQGFTRKSNFNFPLPFFTNYVLAIARDRDSIPEAVLESVHYFSSLRNEFFELNFQLHNATMSQGEMVKLEEHIRAKIEVYTKGIHEHGNKVSDMFRLVGKFLITPARLLNLFGDQKMVLQKDFPFLFAHANFNLMRNSLKVDNVHSNINNFLTKGELNNIRASRR